MLRNDLDGNPTLRELLKRARETALGAYAHQDLPFDRVVDSVSPVRSLSRNPLFQVVVHVRDHLSATRVIDTAAAGSGEQDTVCTSLDPIFDMAHADLSVNFFGTDGAGDIGYHCNVIYRTELYARSTIERLAHWLTWALTEFANDLDQTLRDVQLIDAEDQHRILQGWTRGEQPPHDRPRTIPELLEPSRMRGPGRIAVRCGTDSVDYPALHRRSDNLAALLVQNGVGPGSLVGLSTRRSIEMVVGLVAIMKAGAGYFPIDPGYPLARKQFMLDDVQPPVVVVTVEAVDTHAAGARGGADLAGRSTGTRPGGQRRRECAVGGLAAARPRRPDVPGVHVRVHRQAERRSGNASLDGSPARLAAAALPAADGRRPPGAGLDHVPRRRYGDAGRPGSRRDHDPGRRCRAP